MLRRWPACTAAAGRHCSIQSFVRKTCSKGQALANDREPPPQAAYVHLPFCKKRCFYCDFPVQAVGLSPDAPPVQSSMQQYVDTLCREIRATDTMGTQGLRTVFFGGGTPSLLPPHLLRQVLQVLKEHLGMAADPEISMEADPGTFDVKKLQDYMDLGINRFSIGVQAFQQDALERCGRSHGLEDVRQAIRDVKAAGVSNWSLDLISGLPGTDLQTWEASLREALAAGPTHISIYDLQLEQGTKFGKFTPGQFPLPSDEVTAAMFCTASEVLQAGDMEHYEVCSYAQPGFRCRHNQVYWDGQPYHAFGLGATSLLGHQRFARPRKMAAYKSWVAEFETSARKIPGVASENEEEDLLDLVMLRLRLADGLDLASVAARFGAEKAAAVTNGLRKHIHRGLVQEIGHVVRLQDPQGFLFSNDIISDVFVALEGL